MKKSLVKIISGVTMVATLVGVPAFAMGNGQGQGKGMGQGQGTGIRQQLKDGSGAGSQEGKGLSYGVAEFIDENQDGVCDNLGTRVRPLDGSGYGAKGPGGQDGRARRGGRGLHDGTGSGPKLNFVDADGNGVCDYME